MPKILFSDAAEVITNQGVVNKNGVGITAADLGIIENGSVLWDSVKGILWIGKKGEKPPAALVKGAKKRSLKGQIIAPAFTDCHTHLVFGGSRHNELALRLQGAKYQEIAASGGGIASSVRATRETSEAELYEIAHERLERCIALGVGAIEIKSGYGLDWPTERKLLRVIAKLRSSFKGKVLIQSTFLGAHAFPPGTKTAAERSGYVDEIVDKMLPQVVKEKLADACDVFFDEGYFDEDQSRRILTKAVKLGLKIKLHADELADTRGASLAAELGALSADHLLKAHSSGLEYMGRKGVVAVLLPTTALYLGIPYASMERMRTAKVCVALASDFNPGSSPTFHMPFVMSLACLQMGMTMPEAFAAATYGSARALGFHEQMGSLRVGKRPKIAIFNCPSYQALIAQVAHPALCEAVF
jgi:imidazolonepropionase